LKIVIGAAAGRASVLKRAPAGDPELPRAARLKTAEVMGAELSATEAVRRIVADVRSEGDAALRRYCEAFDGVPYARFEVPREEIEAAAERVPGELRDALELAASRVRSYHEDQRRRVLDSYRAGPAGVQVRPIETAGLHVPGTHPVYPSSVIHTVCPAKAAGVPNAFIFGPAGRDGRVPALKLAAAAIAGADRVFMASGAQAIAAFAYGTESIPRVDKICGPGNIFVTLAKRSVFGDVGIDSLYGPSETIVIAGPEADPVLCAADLIAQAEHDELAKPILLVTSEEQAREVAVEVERQVAVLDREAVARHAFEAQGGAVVVDSLEEAVALASEFAPEHLCLLTREARRLLPLVRNAGAIFIGEGSPEAVGDYTAGPSHVMPTGGAARYASPLSVLDFLKFSTVVDLSHDDVAAFGPAGAVIAREEGFGGHARAIEERLR
jgi:histidinol dehydrogenase